MAEEKKTNTPVKSDNNMKFAVTIIIVLVALLAVAVFALQQKKNDGTTAESTSGSTIEGTQEESQDAGAVGKNEVKLTDANFKTEVEDYKGVVLVDFYLSTCPHCQNVAKDVTSVSDELVGKAKVGKLESRENKTTSDKFGIEGVPTFIVFKDGVQAEKVSGEKTKEELLALVNKYLK
ncbi:MAG: thioredoxin domain-containing protein [Patescibacteria group bacterium]